MGRKEKIDWEIEIVGERIEALDRRPRLNQENLVRYPERIYHRGRAETLLRKKSS